MLCGRYLVNPAERKIGRDWNSQLCSNSGSRPMGMYVIPIAPDTVGPVPHFLRTTINSSWAGASRAHTRGRKRGIRPTIYAMQAQASATSETTPRPAGVVDGFHAACPQPKPYPVKASAVLRELRGHSRISHRRPNNNLFANPRTVPGAFTALSKVFCFSSMHKCRRGMHQAQNHLNVGGGRLLRQTPMIEI